MLLMDGLTAFQRDLLYVIAGLENGTPPYGLALKDSVDEEVYITPTDD